MLPPDCRLDMMLGGIAAVIVGGVLLICCYIAFLGGSAAGAHAIIACPGALPGALAKGE